MMSLICRYNMSYSPTWYKVALAKHQKIVRGLPDWKTALFMNNIQIGSRLGFRIIMHDLL